MDGNPLIDLSSLGEHVFSPGWMYREMSPAQNAGFLPSGGYCKTKISGKTALKLD